MFNLIISKAARQTAVVVFLILIGPSCSDKCQVTSTYVYYEPVYTPMSELQKQVDYVDPVPLKNLGRIYFKDNVIFINEVGEGIHLIDNNNPRSPKGIGFLKIPGNFDLAIIGNSLYADSYVDLVVFDISNLADVREVTRIPKLFDHYQSLNFSVNSEKGILTDWKMVKNITIEESDCKSQLQPWGGIYLDRGIAISANTVFESKTALIPNGATGIGGSLARFTINASHLYALDGSFMDVVDVSMGFSPKAKNEIEISWGIETLFPYGNKLFVGSRTGMMIYDLTVPQAPSLFSQYNHLLSCDPVVIQGDYAFVTLFSGSVCRTNIDQLEIIDLKDLKSPRLVKTYPLHNPKGLGVDKDLLFICDGSEGLKIYDAHDVTKIQENLLFQYKGVDALDIIPYNNVAMVIGSDGLYQYDYADLKEIKLLSKLAIVKP